MKNDCIYYDTEPNETPYCNKYHKYLDDGCGECKKVTFADVVEVVWCKDCIHYRPYENEEYGYCYFVDDIFDADDYCSYGQREE